MMNALSFSLLTMKHSLNIDKGQLLEMRTGVKFNKYLFSNLKKENRKLKTHI